jgi:uncharacterized protein
MNEATGPAPGTILGKIIGLWRYPVKSMGGEVLASVEAAEGGFAGDRAFGVVDMATGLLLSAKRVPQLLHASARYRTDGEVLLVLPGDNGGTVVSSDDPLVNEALGDWLQRSVYLDRPSAGQQARIEIEINLDDPTDIHEFRTRPGLFFDGSVLHLLTTASIAAATKEYPAGPWIPERFRPNVLIETSAVGWVEDGWVEDGWVEDAWVGHQLDVSGMRVDVHKRCDRCVLTTRAVAGTPADKEILRTLARSHGGDLGVKAHVLGVGRVLVGDEVRIAADT